jgi:hypothetical protein
MQTRDNVQSELDRIRNTIELLPADAGYDDLRMICHAQFTALAWVMEEFDRSPSEMADDAIRMATDAADEANNASPA